MKRRDNVVANSYKHSDPAALARYRLRNRRRASLQDGKIRIRFIKLMPAAPVATLPTCRECGGYVLPTETVCAGCWARSLTPPSPPWPGGAA